MSERLIDAVCPHCGVQGTTVRVVLHEDGYTKLSRRCTACGGEFVHTFDHDWLAVAKNKKLQADNERLRAALKPFAALFLWPDDVDDELTDNDILSDEDLSENRWRYLRKNDAAIDEKWVRRGDIRAARKALEGKP